MCGEGELVGRIPCQISALEYLNCDSSKSMDKPGSRDLNVSSSYFTHT